MKRFLTTLILGTMLITIPSIALKQNEIQPKMQEKINSAILILDSKGATKEQKARKIFAILDEVFDYPTMARIALGKGQWDKITQTQRDDFIKAFEMKLKQSYVEKLELYDNQKVSIIKVAPHQNGRLQLQTQLIGKGEIYPVNYNFHDRGRKNNWLIYDVDISGVSIIQTYRQQFAGLLKTKSFDELLRELKQGNIK